MFDVKTVSAKLGSHEIFIETGKMARQASGSVEVKCGDARVLVAVCTGPAKDVDFLPLTVNYEEKMYAAGKIPGGFFKREGRPTEKEVITSRLIDRPIRPMFADGWNCETQVTATVTSADQNSSPDILAMIGTSAALGLSDAPFLGPIAACRVCRVDSELVINPGQEQLEEKHVDIDLTLAATQDAILMVEGGADEASEEDVVAALLYAHEQMQPILKVQEDLFALAAKPTREFEVKTLCEDLKAKVEAAALTPLTAAVKIPVKLERYEAIAQVKSETLAALVPADDADDAVDVAGQVESIFDSLKKKIVREMITQEKIRIDGRDLTTIRPIKIEENLLPRVHGSSLFTRGETQALVSVTLGIPEDVQYIDNLLENSKRSFMLHYNFPPFSVGETRPMRGPGRREIGHGSLAERSLKKVIPTNEEFPYVIRIVSEILESNGSSSMASVCGGSLALMSAGVPIKAPVAGIAMGLIKEGDDIAILTDILGDEDHLGDMDFKVTGTKKGIMAIQMDIKITGIDKEILTTALNQAKDARLNILETMENSVPKVSEDMSLYAPRVEKFNIKPNKIGAVIGPGGSVIKKIVEETGAKVSIEDSGQVSIYAANADSLQQAKAAVDAIVEEAVLNRVYRGKVKKITEFGAFVEVIKDTDGLLHISEISSERVENVEDVLKEGEMLNVKLIRVDARSGKLSLSKKQVKGDEEVFERVK